MNTFLKGTAFKLIMAIFAGALAGQAVAMLFPGPLTDALLQVLMIAKHLSGQVILFMIPLIIFGCVAPSISRFGSKVTSLIGFTLVLAYASSVGAAALSIGVSQWIVPSLHFGTMDQPANQLPPSMLVNISFPTVDTMSALLLAILIGLGTVWANFGQMATFLDGFQRLTLIVVRRVLVPVLPWFVGSNFALLAYKGQLGQMQIFLSVVALIVACQLVWIVVMYAVASFYARRNGLDVLRCYPKAYITAVGTMSSAATLPVALECISDSRVVKRETYDFALPLFSNFHLCGSVIAEMFLVTSVHYLMFGTLPATSSMILFALLACVIAIGSPGVPGGLNMSCMTLVATIVLPDASTGLQAEYFGIMTAIYTVQDGFGTACNVTTDGALALMTQRRVDSIEEPALQ